MRFISCHGGKLQTLDGAEALAGLKASPGRAFATGLGAIDALAPGGQLARGAIHELLFDPGHAAPRYVAGVFASAAGGTVIWSDPGRELYPPALAAMGFDLARTYLLRPASEADEAWAVTECLRCRGVGAVVAAAPQRLSRIVARRLQLAAERGGSVGLLLRPRGNATTRYNATTRPNAGMRGNARTRGCGDSVYAAATRWLVSPHPGERTVQRWAIQLLHGHGGRVGQTVFLECCRETNSVRAVEQLADRPAAATAPQRGRASA